MSQSYSEEHTEEMAYPKGDCGRGKPKDYLPKSGREDRPPRK